MRKILFISGHLPYPVVNGGRMRTSSFVETLAESHELFLIYKDFDREEASAPELMKYFKKIWRIPLQNKRPPTGENSLQRFGRRLGLLFKAVLLQSWEMQSRDLEFEKKIQYVLEQEKIDVIFCRYMAMAKHLISIRKQIRAKIIVDLDDIETIKNDRDIRSTEEKGSYSYYRKLLNNKLFERYHKNLRSFDAILICSEKDKDYILQKKWSTKVHIVVNSIDVGKYAAIPVLSEKILDEKVLLCCGSLSYKPNIDGLKWFLRAIWPLIIKNEPACKLYMVGRDPDSSLKGFVDERSVFLFPNVASVAPYYEKACATIVPLLAGGGTRIKILESFSAHRPVISTTIGAEGLGVSHEGQCLIADAPEDFAGQCLRLLRDHGLAQQLTQEGYKFVKECYDITIIKRSIKEVFDHYIGTSDQQYAQKSK